MFRDLKIYTVHVKPGADISRSNQIFVREGFNFKAFVFTIFWALFHRMWKYAFLLLLLNACIMSIMNGFDFSHRSQLIVQIAFNILIGYDANDSYRTILKKRGYLLADIICGTSLAKAELRYFERSLAARAA